MGLQQLISLSFLSTLSYSQILLTLTLLHLLHTLLTALYNLFLHPLSSIPGPLLARTTHLHAYYHNLLPPGGTFTLDLPRLHALYGPVIRTEPNTLHFSTQSAYNTIYTRDGFTKAPRFYQAMGNSGLGAMTDSSGAKRIRELLAPEFTRGRVLGREVQGIVVTHLGRLTERLVEESGKDQGGVNLLHATRSSALDVITELGMGKSFESIEVPGFGHPILEMLEFSLALIWWRMYFLPFRWLMGPFVNLCVEQLGWKWVLGSFGLLRDLALRTYLEAVREEKKKKGRELMTRRMVKEGWGSHLAVSVNLDLVAAGSDPSGGAMCYGIVCVAADEEIESRLVEEVKGVWRDGREDPPGLEVLERLPVLSGAVKEALRMAMGLCTPLLRVAEKDMVIDGIKVPKGTEVGVSGMLRHLDPDVFTDPHKFDPFRWINPTPDMNAAFNPFSKGARMCPAMNLGHAEMILGMAMVFRRCKVTIPEGVDAREMLKYRDNFVAVYPNDIRVHVRAREE